MNIGFKRQDDGYQVVVSGEAIGFVRKNKSLSPDCLHSFAHRSAVCPECRWVFVHVDGRSAVAHSRELAVWSVLEPGAWWRDRRHPAPGRASHES